MLDRFKLPEIRRRNADVEKQNKPASNKNQNTYIAEPSLDPTFWSKEEIEANIEQLVMLANKQEKIIKAQYTRCIDYIHSMEDTDDFRKEDVKERLCLQGDIMKIASKIEDLKKQLAENLAEYDNDKFAIAMETKVNEDLKRQIKRLKQKHERLLKKQIEMKFDKELLEEFDNSKGKFIEEQRKNERLNQKLYWYDKELSKINEEKFKENHKAKDGTVPRMSERKSNQFDDYNERMPITYCYNNKFTKLPLIGIKVAESGPRYQKDESSMRCTAESQNQPGCNVSQPLCKQSDVSFHGNRLPPISNNASINGHSGNILPNSLGNVNNALNIQRKVNRDSIEHNGQLPTNKGTSTKYVGNHVPHPPSQRPNTARRYVRKQNNR